MNTLFAFSTIAIFLALTSSAVHSAAPGKVGSINPNPSAGEALVAEFNAKLTKINWRIAPTDGNKYRVTLTINNFQPSTYGAIGFNDVARMPGAFIVSCEKNAKGEITINQRYALGHVQPPITEWGVVARPSSGNTCEFDIPRQLKAPDTVDGGKRAVINLASGSGLVKVLNSRGQLDGQDDIQYHGKTKEITALLFKHQ